MTDKVTLWGGPDDGKEFSIKGLPVRALGYTINTKLGVAFPKGTRIEANEVTGEVRIINTPEDAEGNYITYYQLIGDEWIACSQSKEELTVAMQEMIKIAKGK